ncbi:hypothetical protein K9U39_12055 [Rhodoblastus acidophilus]|uniref:Selenocysteine lyase/Cysteine desulfurase n=1 Tax=Candidatus Rhodoblastus alkanivorans TaxID=2954117 RepID=A0ABS9Z9T2_9HYPH|nr:hypothetical protein [Candidatus Rhodoblastus alkanivorans]MCI4679836.1 hypothetical protein [Candidatus Rhodoblastus alkanivorans]MCI4684342.1 hypothetical protein [Candidatus Rhodoblastus alkanivorans]MDI4641663.1 hypothetical protein [Rhodoblastus acidophilus]
MNKPFQIFPFASVPAHVATPVHAGRAASGAVLDLFLFGPDERLGEASAGPRWATGEIWFSSCDAVALSARAHRAARETYAGVFGGEASRPLPHWLDELRRRLAGLFGARNCEAVLAASVHEGEMLFAALARAASDRPIVHVAAPPERPEGAGQPAETFALRDRYGLALPADDIDSRVARQVAEAIAKGADVALHVTDCSETGLSAPSRAAVAALEQDHPGRLTVLIDARQMRAGRETIAADLDAGRAVLLSGSTFAGGPCGAAAVLLPGALIERIGPFDLPGALAFQSAALDWPPILRERRRGAFAALADPRLGLRWESALAELEALFAIAPDMRAAIASAFLRETHRHLAAAPLLKATDFRHPGDGAPTILPILTFDERGRAIRAANLRRALAEPAARPGRRAARGRPIHLGAPVAIGSRDALRLALGAPQVNDVAERLAAGESFAEAFRPLADDLHETFARWSELAQDGL